MTRLDDARLIDMALAALEEVTARCYLEPVAKTRALALVLAYLASKSRGDRWPFDNFWRAIASQRPKDRSALSNASLNAIYLAVGQKRDTTIISIFESEARGANR